MELRKKKGEESKLNMKEIKKAVKNRFQEWDDRDSARIRMKFMDRWAELSGVEKDENGKYDYSKIDYDNKWVQLEWNMCDVRIFAKLTNDKTRAEGVLMLPEECRETYYQTGPGNDKPYSEVNFGMSAVRNTVRKMRKGKGVE